VHGLGPQRGKERADGGVLLAVLMSVYYCSRCVIPARSCPALPTLCRLEALSPRVLSLLRFCYILEDSGGVRPILALPGPVTPAVGGRCTRLLFPGIPLNSIKFKPESGLNAPILYEKPYIY